MSSDSQSLDITDDIWEQIMLGESKTEEVKSDIDSSSMILHEETCKNAKLVEDQGFLTCSECGIVVNKVFDRNPEWTRNEDGKADGSARCGVPTNVFLPCSSLGTSIVGAGFYRLKKLHSWNQMPYKERSLSEVLQDIEGKCRTFKITKGVIMNAQVFYKKISEIKHSKGLNKDKNVIIRGINRRSIIAACVFYGALKQDTPYSPKEIGKIFNLEMTQITKGIRHFEKLLENDKTFQDIKSSDPTKFIKSYYQKIGLNQAYVPEAYKISKNIGKLDIASNHQPISIAAGIILLMSKIHELPITKKRISEIFNTSEVTVNKIYNKINEYRDVIIDDNLTNKWYQALIAT